MERLMANNLKWFLKLFKPYKGILIFAFLGAVLEGVAYSGLSFVLKNLIDRVLVDKNLTLLWVSVGLLLFFGLLKQVGFLLSELLYRFAVSKITARLRVRLYSKITSIGLEDFQKYPQGEWLGRITNDIRSFKDYSEGFGIKVIREFFTALFLIGVLLYFDWQLFLVFALIVPFFGKAFKYFGSKRKKYSLFYQEVFAEFIGFISNLLENFENIKFLNRFFLNKIARKKVRKLFKAEFKQSLYSAGYLSAVEMLGYLFAAAVFLYGGYMVAQGELTAGTFISFIGTLFLLYNSLQALQRNALNYKALEPVITRIREVLEKIPTERGGKETFKGLNKTITALNVVYPKEDPILRSVNFQIPKGSKVFVKGASGGGKSTLLKVVSSLYLSYGGSLKYDKTELRDFLLPTFRRKVFYISQRSAIFNDTVRNNLLLAKPSAAEEELRRALELAEASFVFDLPKGLDTPIGGGGVELSGGQRQRIALARLFLTDPEVAFLDEATSALDPETEERVLRNILSHLRDRTLFFVSHRPHLEGYFDLTLEVENGKVSLKRKGKNG